jgi:hypothetical protein
MTHAHSAVSGIMLTVHLFFIFLSVGLVTSGYNLFPFDLTTLPLNLNNQPWYKRELASSGWLNFPGRSVRRDC